MAYKFGRIKQNRTHLDLIFLDGDRKRGEIRLKPNGVLWAGANEKGWRKISLRAFEEFIKAEGTRQKK
jgi:hypothetical protein